jgi:hypothetical protein
VLIFVVALQSPQASKNWSHVCRLWERTLRSICAQTNPDFRVVLVCNERPKIDFTHEALTVIEEEFPLPQPTGPSRMADKWRKVRRGLTAARHLAPAHVMIMDADDCVSRNLAALVAQKPEARGWVFNQGYIHDEGTGWLHRKSDFDRYCGTSAIVKLAPEDIPAPESKESSDNFYILANGHGVIADYLRDRGEPLERLPFVGAIYITATGENDSGVALRNWRGKKMMLTKLLNSRPLTAKVRNEFGLYTVPA